MSTAGLILLKTGKIFSTTIFIFPIMSPLIKQNNIDNDIQIAFLIFSLAELKAPTKKPKEIPVSVEINRVNTSNGKCGVKSIFSTITINKYAIKLQIKLNPVNEISSPMTDISLFVGEIHLLEPRRERFP